MARRYIHACAAARRGLPASLILAAARGDGAAAEALAAVSAGLAAAAAALLAAFCTAADLLPLAPMACWAAVLQGWKGALLGAKPPARL